MRRALRQTQRGQAMVEYLVVGMTVLAALIALGWNILGSGVGLMQNVNYQLGNARGTADFLFR